MRRLHDELGRWRSTRSTSAAFAIDRDEVSVADYRACIAAGVCNLDPLIAGDERYIHDDVADRQRHLVRGPGLLPLARRPAADRGRVGARRAWRRPTGAVAVVARGADDGCVERPEDFNHGQPRAAGDARDRSHDRLIALQLIGDPDDSRRPRAARAARQLPVGRGAVRHARPGGQRRRVDRRRAAATATTTTLGYDGLRTVINPRRDGSVDEPRVVRGGSWRQPSVPRARERARPVQPHLRRPTSGSRTSGFAARGRSASGGR